MINPLHPILVGVDFSPACRVALKEAIRWSHFDGAPITALHILDLDTADKMAGRLGLHESALLQHVTERLKAFIRDTDPGSADAITAKVEIGHPFVNLSAACGSLGAALLVLGSRGTEHSLGQLGVIAAKCLRKAPANVLVVKENSFGPFRQVLSCVDFSEASAKALRLAGRVAQSDQAQLDCLYVHRCTYHPAMDYGMSGTNQDASVKDLEVAELWEKELADFAAPLVEGANGLNPRKVVVTASDVRTAVKDHIRSITEAGAIDRSISGHIAATHAGLVVLGTRGKTDLRTLVIGTTAERIVESAQCSILAVKPDDFNELSE